MTALVLLVGILALNTAFAYPNRWGLDFPENHRSGGISSRIVSGWEAEEGQFPYQLSLRMVTPDGVIQACGASLIHNEWALTAAHCTAGRVNFIIRAGATSVSRPQVTFETPDFYNHPDYDDALPTLVQINDIGLIKFNLFLEYTDLIQPIRLQSSVDKNRDYTNVRLVATGWGATWTGGESPDILNWVFLRGTSNFNCRVIFGGSPIIVDSTICAGYYNVTSQSTCQGDSGGPLVVTEDDGKLAQVGVFSFVANSGCHLGFPAGFIRPGHYHEWLTAVTGINFDWDPNGPSTTTEADVVTTTTDATTEADITTTESGTTEAPITTTEADSPTTEAEGTTAAPEEPESEEDGAPEEEDDVSEENEEESEEEDSESDESSDSDSDSESNGDESDETRKRH